MFIRYLHTVAIVILLFASAANGQPLRRLKGDAKGVAGAGAGNAKKGVAEVESAKKGVAGVAGSRNTKKGVAGVAGVAAGVAEKGGAKAGGAKKGVADVGGAKKAGKRVR